MKKNELRYEKVMVITYVAFFVCILTLITLSSLKKYRPVIPDQIKDDLLGEENGVSKENSSFRSVVAVSELNEQYGIEVSTKQLESEGELYSLTIDADIYLPELDSMVRVVLVDEQDREYLVYESYVLLEEAENVSVSDACEESCYLDGVVAKRIKIQTAGDAEIDINDVKENEIYRARISNEKQSELRTEAYKGKVGRINEGIKRQGLRWKAGESEFAELSYDAKRKMYGGTVPNWQGFEYYGEGIFETLEDRQIFAETPPEASIYVDSWDWRENHGANDPTSFYYDGDPDPGETGNGWMTSAKNQGSCGSCGIFAVTGAMEAVANLYFNQHIDLDLAEQNAVSCVSGTCANGWFPGTVLDYYTNTGVVDEACFPYQALDTVPCEDICAEQDEIIKISGRINYNCDSADTLKGLIIDYGPLSGGIYSWGHAMALLGWTTDIDSQSIWIFKNSYGPTNTYRYIKVPYTDIGWTHALRTPIIETKGRTIQCYDADGDGFYFWGISDEQPASCPGGIPSNKDCDDSDPDLAMYDYGYECIEAVPRISVVPSSYNFQSVPVDQTSSAQEFAIYNIGANTLEVSNILVEDTEYFSVNLNPVGSSNPCGQIDPTIEVDEFCSIEVTFTPISEGQNGTNLLVYSDDPATPVKSVPLLGTGSYSPQVICLYFGCVWSAQIAKCYGLGQSECLYYSGSPNICDSFCKSPFGCTQDCIPSCSF